jgi:hypothetical protein
MEVKNQKLILNKTHQFPIFSSAFEFLTFVQLCVFICVPLLENSPAPKQLFLKK